MRALGIIPARGGSKGVKHKNVRLVGGRPLIAYTLQAAAGSQALTRSVVSTDDEAIAAVAREYGAPVLIRPPELAADNTPMVPVIQHALRVQAAYGEHYDAVVVLQPTAPLRQAADIDASLRLLADTGADTVLSVCDAGDHHPARMYRLADGYLQPYAPEPPARLRQALPPVYHRNGAIYACWTRVLDGDTLIGERVRPYLMPRARSINIDEEFDLAIADFMLSRVEAAGL
jgi:CMP-N,N'-diacetyllegionaminic acid synthase